MNHNELEGWKNPETILQQIQVVYLYSDHDHERVEKRMEICRAIFEKHTRHVIDIVAEGASLLEQYYYLIHLTDWITYFVSREYQVDPDPIDSINFVKQELAKLK
jgi:glucose/mannose-6-phosphate isomerase